MLQQIVVQEEDGASKIWSKTNGWVVQLKRKDRAAEL